MMIYKTEGVCSQEIHLEVTDGIIRKLSFVRGCDGNLKGVIAMAIGRPAVEVINQLKGITCNHRTTSCPDQLAQALTKAIAN